jgi:hypothetical protein
MVDMINIPGKIMAFCAEMLIFEKILWAVSSYWKEWHLYAIYVS